MGVQDPGIKAKFANWMGAGKSRRSRKDQQAIKTGLDGGYLPLNTSVTFDPPKNIKDGLPKDHPFLNEYSHLRLMKHIVDRMDLSREVRDNLNLRLRNIDADVHNYVKLSDDDRQRMKDNRSGKGGQKPVDVSLPLAQSKLDEIVTFLLEVFWPNDGMHSAYGAKKDQEIAQAFAAVLNQDAARREHYRKLAMFFLDCCKYNMGAMLVEWTVETGMKLKNDRFGAIKVEQNQTVFEGNDLKNLDLYNFFFDPSCAPVDLPKKGEYFAFVELKTRFDVQREAAQEKILGIERFINADAGQVGTATMYYQERPVLRWDYNSYSGSQDWLKFATGGKYGTIGTGVEIVTMFAWLNPKDFNLSNDNEIQLWKFKMANRQYICWAEHINNVHQMLPVIVGMPYEDQLMLQNKSAAEMLADFQRFASFLMNIHQTSMRKKLFGLTIYDPTMVDLSQQGDNASARIPVNPAGYGKKIEEFLKTINDAPETEATMDDIKKIIELMEDILPTNIIKQVTDLDRATTYQAAATVQGSNRRSIKLAKMLDDQAIKKMRYMMMFNIMQYKQTVDIILPDGTETQADPSKFRDLDVDLMIGEGVQGIDKLMTIHLLHDVINSVLQSQQASQEIDIVELLNYWTTLIGDRTNLNQFRRQQSPQQQVENDQNQQQLDQNQQEINQNASAAGSAGAAGAVADMLAKGGAK